MAVLKTAVLYESHPEAKFSHQRFIGITSSHSCNTIEPNICLRNQLVITLSEMIKFLNSFLCQDTSTSAGPPPHHFGNRHPIDHSLNVSWFLPQRVGSRLDQGNEKQRIPNLFKKILVHISKFWNDWSQESKKDRKARHFHPWNQLSCHSCLYRNFAFCKWTSHI